jgi:hypothetical protein
VFYLPPVLFGLLITVAVSILLVGATQCFPFLMEPKAEEEEDKESNERDNRCSGEIMLSRVSEFVHGQIDGTLWWMKGVYENPLGLAKYGNRNDLRAMVSITLIALCLSPFFVFGTLTAFYWYALNIPLDDKMAFMIEVYQLQYALFSFKDFEFPAFSFDLSLVIFFGDALDDMQDFASVDPTVLLLGAQSVTAVNFLVSILKPLLSNIANLNTAIDTSAEAGLVKNKTTPLGKLAMDTEDVEEKLKDLKAQHQDLYGQADGGVKTRVGDPLPNTMYHP